MCRETGRSVRIGQLKRFPAGFSWMTYAFTTENEFQDGSGRPLILRLGPPNGLFAPYSAQPQFQSLAALHGSAVPVPAAYWCSDDESVLGAPFFISELVAGQVPTPMVTAQSQAFEAGYRDRLADQFVDALAAIHTFDWNASPLKSWDHGITPETAAWHEIDHWASLYRRWALRPHPVVHWALGWLRQHQPVAPRISIIHGDYRIGNFLERDGRITAILDWELVHLGDPHEDIAWACLPQFMGGSGLVCRLLTEDAFCRKYEMASGIAIDPASVTFYKVFGLLKLAIIYMAAAHCFEQGHFDDLRMPALGIEITAALYQLRKVIGGAS